MTTWASRLTMIGFESDTGGNLVSSKTKLRSIRLLPKASPGQGFQHLGTIVSKSPTFPRSPWPMNCHHCPFGIFILDNGLSKRFRKWAEAKLIVLRPLNGLVVKRVHGLTSASGMAVAASVAPVPPLLPTSPTSFIFTYNPNSFSNRSVSFLKRRPM